MLKNNQNIVGLKDLRENLEDYVEAIGRGRSFIVVRKSKPIFRIGAWQEADDLWESVIDFTKIKKGGIKLEQLLKRI